MVASQNAPLNLALTGVPTSRKAGTSLALKNIKVWLELKSN